MQRVIIASILGMSLLLAACQRASQMPDPETAGGPNLAASENNVELGLAYLREGERARAKQKLIVAIEQGPDNQQAYEAMAFFYEQTAQNDLAQQYYEKALSLDRHSGRAQNNYGAFLCRQGHYQQAITHFRAALNDKQYLTPADALENAGLCALKVPEQAAAQHFFQQAIAQDPNRPASLLELAAIAVKQADYKQALQYLQQYRQYTLASPRYLWLNIQVAKHFGQLDKAASDALLLKGKFPQSKQAKLLHQLG